MNPCWNGGWRTHPSCRTCWREETRGSFTPASRAQYFSIAHGDWRNTQGGVDQRIMGCQRDTRLFRLGARCSETNMTNPWHTQWFLYIYLTSGSRISGAVPIFRHPCMLPVKHSMVRQPQQKQVRQAQQLRPKLCDSQLLVTRCHESTTEGPSDSLGEKLPITQDIWVHWAQTRFLGVGPPEFIRTFLQDSWAVPIKSCQEGCGGTCSINPASGREAGGAPVVWECSFSTDCKSHWVNCQILDKFYPNDRKQLHLQLAFLQLQSLLKRRSRRHIQTSVEWLFSFIAGVMKSCWYHVIHFEIYEFCSAVLVPRTLQPIIYLLWKEQQLCRACNNSFKHVLVFLHFHKGTVHNSLQKAGLFWRCRIFKKKMFNIQQSFQEVHFSSSVALSCTKCIDSLQVCCFFSTRQRF